MITKIRFLLVGYETDVGNIPWHNIRREVIPRVGDQIVDTRDAVWLVKRVAFHFPADDIRVYLTPVA